MIDFKTVLFNKDRNNLVFVFVDRLGKDSVFILYKKTITAPQIAELFLIHVYRYYRAPESIISDRGP
jgi:hypothetical protein